MPAWEDCKQCPQFGRGGCTLIGDFYDVTDLDVGCPKEWPEIAEIQENTLEHFLFYRNSIEYFRWLSYQRRDELPQKGDLCLTLKSGFSSSTAGRCVIVDELYNEYNLFLRDMRNPEKKFCVDPAKWWESLYIIRKSE